MLKKIKEILLETTVKAGRKESGQEITSKEEIHLSNEKWENINHNCTILGGKSNGSVKIYEIIGNVKIEDNSLTVLSGYEYGKSIVEEQLLKEISAIDDKSILIINMPKEIKSVSYSFSKGFNEAIRNIINSEELICHILIKGDDRVIERLSNSIKEGEV